MSIQAHTNEQGSHTAYKSLVGSVDRIDGPGKNRPRIKGVQFLGTVPEAYSYKQPTIRSDGRMATEYRREVQRVVTDQPFERKLFREQPGESPRYVELDETFTDYISRIHGPFGYNPLYATGVYANCMDEANTEALNDLQKDALQAPVSLAEGRKTADMLAENASQLARALRAARRGNWGEVAAILGLSRSSVLTGKYPANKWLEYQYGWRPLKSDIYNTVEQVKKEVTKDLWIKGRGTGTWTDDLDFPYQDLDVTGSAKWSMKTVLTGRVTAPGLYRMQGLGLLNPAIIAWELLPFSFVFDWFVPVGSVLNALTATAGLTPWGGYTSCKGEYELQIRQSGRSDQSGTGYSYTTPNKGMYVERGFQFRRVTYASSWPIPDFYVDFTPFSTERVLSAASLVRSLHG